MSSNSDLVFLRAFLAGSASEGLKDACPVADLLGAQLVALGDEKIEISFSAHHQLLQGAGFIQGGQLSSMLDFAMALVVLSKLEGDANISTISMNTDFQRPVKVEPLVATAWITKLGRQIAFTAAKLKNAEGLTVATATASSMIVKMPEMDQ